MPLLIPIGQNHPDPADIQPSGRPENPVVTTSNQIQETIQSFHRLDDPSVIQSSHQLTVIQSCHKPGDPSVTQSSYKSEDSSVKQTSQNPGNHSIFQSCHKPEEHSVIQSFHTSEDTSVNSLTHKLEDPTAPCSSTNKGNSLLNSNAIKQDPPSFSLRPLEKDNPDDSNQQRDLFLTPSPASFFPSSQQPEGNLTFPAERVSPVESLLLQPKPTLPSVLLQPQEFLAPSSREPLTSPCRPNISFAAWTEKVKMLPVNPSFPKDISFQIC